MYNENFIEIYKGAALYRKHVIFLQAFIHLCFYSHNMYSKNYRNHWTLIVIFCISVYVALLSLMSKVTYLLDFMPCSVLNFCLYFVIV